MTILVYNGVVFRDCETKAFNQRIEYDESETDVLYSRFTIRVASTLVATSYPDTSFGITPVLSGTSATATERARDIHSRLSEPRKDFWMLINSGIQNERLSPSEVQALGEPGNKGLDGPLLMATGIPDGNMLLHPLSSQYGPTDTVARASVLDVNNGPAPKDIAITEIIGGRSFRVEFEIEVCRKLCVPGFIDTMPTGFGDVVSTGSQILSNRWHLDESKDENWATTRVLEGTMRVAHKSVWPHLLRTVCVPPLLKGYQRVRQTFTDDPTGLVLKYRIEDRQAHAAPPWPAVAWHAHHAESASGPNGSILTGEISIRLTGPPGVDKVQLIGAAGKIAVDRIKGLVPEFVEGERSSFKTILLNSAVVNVLNEPTIELRVQARYTDADQQRALAVRIQEMGKPLTTLTGTDPYEVEGYDPRSWPVPLAYDSDEPAGVFACYLQEPCSVWHSMPGGLDPGVITEPVRPPAADSGYPDGEVYSSSHDLPEDVTNLKEDGESGDSIYDHPYSFVDLENTYATHTGWSQLPYASTSTGDDPSALLVKLHGRIAKRILVMTATREGKMPLLPSLAEDITDPNGIREVMEACTITVKAPELLADGAGRRYSVRAEYVYLMARAPKITEKLRGGSTQLDAFPPMDNWLDLNTSQDVSGAMQ